ncbi:MAG: hypothetical protein AAF575_00260 [Bacteroidota bacterium]
MEHRRIKLVVVDENTLGYIFSEQPNSIHVLRPSRLRGSHYPDFTSIAHHGKNIRLASERDFKDFGVVFDGYRDDSEYEYDQKCFVQNR